MSLRVWGRLSVAPWNLVTTTNKNSRRQKIHHVRLESGEHLVSLACCGFSPPLSFPLCPDSSDLSAVCVPGSPFKEKIIFGFHKVLLKAPRCPGSKQSRWKQHSGFSPVLETDFSEKCLMSLIEKCKFESKKKRGHLAATVV